MYFFFYDCVILILACVPFISRLYLESLICFVVLMLLNFICELYFGDLILLHCDLMMLYVVVYRYVVMYIFRH